MQDDVADSVLEMVEGAARELTFGDPRDPAIQVGPVIDAEAKDKLDRWIADMERTARCASAGTKSAAVAAGHLCRANDHRARPRARVERRSVRSGAARGALARDELDALLDDIAGNGTALTLGIHSRIDSTVARIAARLANGNVYVNRNMIGAVVGSQPFGGSGLSGTGPKAGGPNYLHRLALEQVVTVNTAASGGNATLLAEDDDDRNLPLATCDRYADSRFRPRLPDAAAGNCGRQAFADQGPTEGRTNMRTNIRTAPSSPRSRAAVPLSSIGLTPAAGRGHRHRGNAAGSALSLGIIRYHRRDRRRRPLSRPQYYAAMGPYYGGYYPAPYAYYGGGL